jgi:hypothetical protein
MCDQVVPCAIGTIVWGGTDVIWPEDSVVRRASRCAAGRFCSYGFPRRALKILAWLPISDAVDWALSAGTLRFRPRVRFAAAVVEARSLLPQGPSTVSSQLLERRSHGYSPGATHGVIQ